MGGGNPPVVPPAEALSGTWAVASGSCAIGLTFASGMTYEHDVVCTLSSGASSGLQTEIGTYSATSSRLTFLAAKSTCAGTAKNYYLDYFVDGDRISLVYADGVEIMQRFSPSGTALETFGCYDSTGGFNPGPLAPL